MQNYNSYWDMRAKASRPRRFASAKHNALPKSPPKKQQVEEVLSDTDINENSDSRPFDISNEDFPFLPRIPKAILPTQAQESAPLAKDHSETDMDGNSRLFELSKEDFPLLQSTHETVPSEPAQLTKQAKSSPYSEPEEKEFGSNKISQSLADPSLSTKGEKMD